MGFPSFLLPWFAWGGVAAAAAAVAIHLLNRRRFKIVEWAAMDFLREAIFRSRRILQIRDLFLLALRVLCLLAFGAALARPYFTRSAALTSADQPVHAVVLVDNSLSTSYQKFDGKPLLDEIKEKAKEAIEPLPPGSRISVIPVCGSPVGINYEAYYSVQEASEALAAVEPVDRAARPGAIIDHAIMACSRLRTMPAKKIFLVTDQQVAGEPGEGHVEHLKQLDAELQVIAVAADSVENAWVADVRLRDGVADIQAPAVFEATLGYEGENPRHDVQVTLAVDGATVATQSVDLQPGQRAKIEFPAHRFDVPVEAGRPTYVAAEVSIPHDRLPGDDQRFLVAPVVAALPVVFVDQYGGEEDPRGNRYGDTYWLRRLLAPLTSRADQDRQLIQARHVKLDQLTRETLADARLVVVAGVANPQGATTLLREYVEQGGNLILAAGGDFDPVAWNQWAWNDGLGILPAPLRPDLVGQARDEVLSGGPPFLLDFDTLVHEYFWPEGTPAEELKALFGPPTMFFKAVAVEIDDESAEEVSEAVARHARETRDGVARLDARLREIDQQMERLRSSLDAGAARKRADLEQQRAEIQRQREELRPAWLAWRNQGGEEDDLSAEQWAERGKPRVMGRFTKDALPFMVRRHWGRGQVLLIATSLSPEWTTMPIARQSWWLMDRVARGMLVATLPQRTSSTERSLVLPIPAAQRAAQLTLTAPGGQEQALQVDALDAAGGDLYGVSLGSLTRRGVYRLAAARGGDTPRDSLEARLWEVPVAVNGPAEESELDARQSGGLRAAGRQTFLDATRAVAGSVVQIQGMDLWKWAMTLMLAGLIAEMGLLAWLGGREG